MHLKDLLKKYDIPLPRYTSYPTVPYWDFKNLNTDNWHKLVKECFDKEEKNTSIYIHLPYCESLCTFCACNRRITRNHNVEQPYIDALLKEWSLYQAIFGETPVIKEMHLGGGTPTFFSAEKLAYLTEGILKKSIVADQHEFSIEIHPNYTKFEQLKALAELGFNRVSLGVQDFDPKVQYYINRIQSFEQTEKTVKWSRKLNYSSINIDLVYGLPFQTIESIEKTIQLISVLKPDRIAFYAYAHVPWKSKGQRRYTESDLPDAETRLLMYQTGNQLLSEAGYESIGMDHFALPEDKMLMASKTGKLHRNFMGYTTNSNKLLIGLGASAISDTWNAFMQNEKDVDEYVKFMTENTQFKIANGHLLNEEDLILREILLDLMCRQQAILPELIIEPDFLQSAISQINELSKDGLVHINEGKITVSEQGRLFIRHICAALDARLWRKRPESSLFSKAI